jgi:hypothetical protein
MTNVLIIIGSLLIALVIIVPLVEKYGKKRSGEDARSLSRYVLPLMALLLVLQIIAFYFF